MKDFVINNTYSFDCDNCTICTCAEGIVCEHCSKCLGIDGCDSRAIKIDEVIESNDKSTFKFDLGEFSDFDLDEEESLDETYEVDEFKDELPYIDAMEEGNWEYLDDIEGMEEMLHESNSSEVLVEEFPGLYVINKQKYN